MNPTSGPIDSPTDVLNRLSTEFADITRRMSTVSADVATLRTLLSSPAPHAADAGQFRPAPAAIASPVVPPPMGPPPTFPPRPQTPPWPSPPPVQQHPYSPGAYRPGPFPPMAPIPPRPPLSERVAAASERGLIGKLLAGVGVAITLIGVVLLLVLAAEAGLLRPEVRVAGGGVLATALFGIGVYLGRHPQKRSGAAALVATGVATALFDVLAATAIYQWLPSWMAVLLAGLLAGGGLVVAHRWNSQPLALMVGTPMVAFAPFLTDGPGALLVAFLLSFTAATLWIQVGRDWTAMYAVNTAAGTLPLLSYTTLLPAPDRWFFAVAASVNLLLALVSALVLLRSSTRPMILALVSAAAVLPMIAVAETADTVATGLLGSATLVLTALAVGGGRIPALTIQIRTVWLATAAVTALVALGSVLSGAGLAAGTAGIGLVTAVAAGGSTQMSRPLRVVAAAFTVFALLAMLAVGAVEQLVDATLVDTDDQLMLLIAAMIALAAVAQLTWSWGRTLSGSNLHLLVTAGGLIGLGLITQICVALGAVISGGTVEGFRAGHAAATIVWVVTGAAGLLWTRRRRGSGRGLTLTVSLAIVAAAVAKLFLFDLAALDGMFRVIAFIVVGLLLLSLGVAYAQSLSSADERARTAARM